MCTLQNTTRTCEELLLEYKANNSSKDPKKLKFALGDREGKDVYNITAPFTFNNELLLAGRVEARDSEHSEVIFFTLQDGVWTRVIEYPVFKLQDPFVTLIGNELILGGVEIYEEPENPGILCYRTIFYRGTSVKELKPFAKGPEKMKDIRLLELAQNKILVFTRPQGEIGGRGKIGYTFISSLEELSPETIEKATILEGQFIPEQWGGANELHLLSNGKVGVLSHIASFDEAGNRHYYSSAFCFDVSSGEYTPMKLIAVRSDFLPGESKREDLADVIFSGGIVREENGLARLYCGVSDAEAHEISIKDPFAEYEN